MHKIFLLFPSSGGELHVICFPYKLHVEAFNPFSCVGTSFLCVCVFHATYFPDLLLIFLSRLDLFISLLVASCPHLWSLFLGRHFQWWCLLDNFGLGFLWCCYLDHTTCLMGDHLHMSLLWCFLCLLRFQWCHHRDRLHVLNMFHLIHFVSRCLCLRFRSLGSTQKLDTPWSFMDASS